MKDLLNGLFHIKWTVLATISAPAWLGVFFCFALDEDLDSDGQARQYEMHGIKSGRMGRSPRAGGGGSAGGRRAPEDCGGQARSQ